VQSLYDDVLLTLTEHTFSIPNVQVRKPFDESDKSYPILVLHEIANLPKTHATVTGEGSTVLGYQIDILTQNCVDTNGTVLSRWDAGRRLAAEVSDLLSTTYKITRRSLLDATRTTTSGLTPDVMEFIWRGDCVMDSHDYVYRA
jgi:hypothetical protein